MRLGRAVPAVALMMFESNCLNDVESNFVVSRLHRRRPKDPSVRLA